MSNECICPFSDMKIEDLNGLEKDVLAVQCVNWINALSKNIANISKILQIAAYMPAFEECLAMFKEGTAKENFDKAFSAIKFAVDHTIVNGLYCNSVETIKALAVAIKQMNESYWKEKLLNSLRQDQGLKTSKAWLKNHEEIKLIIETFDFPREGFVEILNEALKDSFLDDIDNWINYKGQICSLIQLFNLPKESAYKRLEDIIRKRITFCSNLLADEMSDGEIIEKTKNIGYDYLSKYLQAGEAIKIAISRESYEKIADSFITRANNSFSKEVRKKLTKIAIYVYVSSTNDRKKIYDIDGSNTNKIIRVASKIIGFKYVNQGLRDTWPIKYFDC